MSDIEYARTRFAAAFNQARDISGPQDDFRREEILNLLGRPLRSGRAGARLAVQVAGGLILVNRRTTTPGITLFCFRPDAGLGERFWMNDSSVESLLVSFESAPTAVFEELLT